MPNQPDENLPDQAVYYPPQSPPFDAERVEWHQAVGAAVEWLDEWDRQSDAPSPLDAAALAGSAHEVIRRLVAAIRERGL
jgi:hypothetical protein